MRTARCAALLAVLVSLLIFGFVSVASASPARSELSHRGARLYSVSCPAVSFCLAVGSHTAPSGARHSLAEEWNGKSWRVLSNPPGVALQHVSCTSLTFCAATGGPLHAGPAGRTEFLTWNGRAWRSHPLPASPTSEISCRNRFYCLVIRQSKEIEAWNGVRWHTVAGTNVCNEGPPGPCVLSALSCATATVCMAIGTLAIDSNGDTGGWAYFYNGHHWTATGAPDNAGEFVACSRQGLCMATGAGADGYTAATGWTQDSPGPSCSDCGIAMPAISCTGLTNCMVVNTVLWTSYTWNGTEWNRVSLAARPTPPGSLDGLSCATATDCILTGGYHRDGRITAFSEQWNGTNWQSVKTPSPS